MFQLTSGIQEERLNLIQEGQEELDREVFWEDPIQEVGLEVCKSENYSYGAMHRKYYSSQPMVHSHLSLLCLEIGEVD